MFILSASLRLTLTAGTAESGWDVHRQREIAARSIAEAAKESILATSELAPVSSGTSLTTELNRRLAAIASAATGITLSSDSGNGSIVVPANPQWPTGLPAATGSLSTSALTALGRSLQGLLAAGDVADLGSRTFTFSETNNSFPGESTNYTVTTRFFSVPVTNFTWIAYGRPTATGGIASVTPSSPGFTRARGFTAPLATPYTNETGTFASMLGSTAPALPYYYRDLVSLTWNAFEYWTSQSYQSTLLTSAGNNIFDFTNTSGVPPDVTWDGVRATVNLNSAQAGLLVFVDSLGGSIIHLIGAGATGTPLTVAVRNYSATPTTIEVAGNNSRSVLIYASNSTIVPATSGLNFRGGVLLFTNSQISGSWAVNGFVAYPQTQAPPSVVAYPDDQAKHDLQNIAPRALLVSARGLLQ